MHDTLLVTETDDNLGYAEQERLGPEFEKFPFVFEHVAIITDFGRGFEFNPVDGIFFPVGFAVPD
jgi:hypothetical protein